MFRTRLNPTKPPAAHRAVLERVGAACRELRPIEEACFAESRPNGEVASILGKHGVLGIGIEAEFGGAGTEPLLCVLAAERIGREGFGPCSFFVSHAGQGVPAIARWGSDGQKCCYLPRAASGACVLGFALNNRRPGSSALVETTFQEIPGGYVLDGQQRAVHNTAPDGAILTLASKRAEPIGTAKRMFVVDTSKAGVRFELIPGQAVPPSGCLCTVKFERCELTPQNVIPGPADPEHIGSGFHEWLASGIANLNARLLLAAGATGAIADCLEIMTPLLASQSSIRDSGQVPDQVRLHVARTAADLEATRALVYAAAQLKAEFDRHTQSEHLARETETLVSEAQYFAYGAVDRMRSRAAEIPIGGSTLLDVLPPRHRDVPRPTILADETSEFLEYTIAREYLSS